MVKHNEKIMNYKGNDFKEFMALFSEEEIKAMRTYLEECYSFEEEEKGNIISAYVKEWLCEQISDNTYRGTEQLFRLWREVL